MQDPIVLKEPMPSLFKLGACFVYDTLVAIALSLACVSVFFLIVGDATHGLKRLALQLCIWLTLAVYFVWCWQQNGQTLAMQTWQLKLVNKHGVVLTWREALVRFLLASLSLMLFGLGFLWIVVDKDRLFLHDRLLGSKLIYYRRSI